MVTKGIIQETLSKVVLAVAGFILNIILARELGPADYGVVGVVLNIMFVIEPLLTNGLRQAVSMIVSSQEVNTRKLWRQSITLQLIFSVVLVAVGLLLLGRVAVWLNIEEHRNTLYLILAIIPIKGIFFLNLGFLNGQFNYKQHALANSLYSFFRLIISLVLLYITRNGVLAVLVGTLAAYLLAMFFTRFEWQYPDSTLTIPNRQLLGLTWGALLFYLLINIILYIDVLLLRGFGSTEATVGYYKASANIGSLLYFLFLSVTQVSYPVIAKLFSQQSWQELKKVANTLFLSVFYTSALAFAFTFFFAEIFIKLLFGAQYLPAAGVTPWYALSIGLLSIIIMLGNMMITFEHKKNYLFILLGSLVLYLLLFIALYKPLEIYAPPVTIIIISVITAVLFVAILNRHYHNVFDVKNLVKNIGVLLLMTAAAVALQLLASKVAPPALSGALIFSALALVSFFAVRNVREAVLHSVSILLAKKK